jgi:hypothetical protein
MRNQHFTSIEVTPGTPKMIFAKIQEQANDVQILQASS